MMSNRAFRRMIAQRRAYLNYESPVLDRLDEMEEKKEEVAPPVPEPPHKSVDEIIYKNKLDNLRSVWHNYKELFDLRIESDDERFEELYEYHKTIEKILSEKS